MSLADAVAAIMFVGVVAYAVFAGADLGCGLWDLIAGGPQRGRDTRSLIDHSIGPVWEANHVWLIYVLVYLWTAFPTAFAATCQTLFVPMTLAAFGIVCRGSTFAFRKFASSVAEARRFGALFAASSVLTPFFLGTVAGAVASARVPLDGRGNRWTSWINQTSMVGGVLAVCTCAFLAAVFLTAEAARQGDAPLVDIFRRRALAASVVTGVVALAGVGPLNDDAQVLFDGLTGRALPLIVVSAVAGVATMFTLWHRRFAAARVAAVVAVASVVGGWGVAQYPWILVGAARIDDVSGDRTTLWSLVIVAALASITVVPALVYLYWLTQRPGWAESEATITVDPTTPSP